MITLSELSFCECLSAEKALSSSDALDVEAVQHEPKCRVQASVLVGWLADEQPTAKIRDSQVIPGQPAGCRR